MVVFVVFWYQAYEIGTPDEAPVIVTLHVLYLNVIVLAVAPTQALIVAVIVPLVFGAYFLAPFA